MRGVTKAAGMSPMNVGLQISTLQVRTRVKFLRSCLKKLVNKENQNQSKFFPKKIIADDNFIIFIFICVFHDNFSEFLRI